jgi:dipeptidyl aminopeptidase/acylaminoacyl peptidase
MEFAAAWSPDGNWCAYVAGHDGGAATLMKVKTTGQASPAQLATAVPWGLPAWSPAGDWIAYRRSRWRLESDLTDGKTVCDLGKLNTQHLVFSKDAKTLFGLREEHARVVLFAVDVKSGAAKDIGKVTGGDARPRSDFNPGMRFSLAPGGDSFVYSTVRLRSKLWLFEGFDRKPDLLERLGLRHR